MTVYVVTSGEYSDYTVHGVYSSKFNASESIDRYVTVERYIGREEFEIKEFELDDLINRESVTADVDKDGFVSLSFGRVDIEDELTEYAKRLRKMHGRVRVEVNYNPNRDVMEKAARDKAAMIRARDMGV